MDINLFKVMKIHNLNAQYPQYLTHCLSSHGPMVSQQQVVLLRHTPLAKILSTKNHLICHKKVLYRLKTADLHFVQLMSNYYYMKL